MKEFHDNDLDRSDLPRIISAYLDGQISESEFSRFNQWLTGDADHAQQFARVAMIHSSLRSVLEHADLRVFLHAEDSADDLSLPVDPENIRRMLEEEEELERIAAEETAKETAKEQARQNAKIEKRQRQLAEIYERQRNRRPEPIVIPRSVGYLSVAAAAVLVVFAVQSFVARYGDTDVPHVAQMEPATPVPTPAIATITESLDARWQDARTYVAPDTRLAAGVFTLETGVIEIAFNSGAHVVAESPIEFELVSPDRLIVSRGRLVAKVPKEAIGFTIVTDAAAIVDLGTEFGVELSDAGDVSVHVLDGEVALVPDGEEGPGPRETLTIGLARRVSTDGKSVSEIEFDRAAFLQEVPASLYELAVLKSRPLVFWRMNETADSLQVASLGRIDVAGTVGNGVTLGQLSRQSGHLSRGRSEPDNRIAMFSGAHAGINLGYVAELALTDSFTLEAWVRTPQSSKLPTPQRIVSTYCETPKAGYAFGIVSQRLLGRPLVGRPLVGREDVSSMLLFFTFSGVYDCISPINLEPGQRTHVVAVINGEGRPTMFVNGEEVATEFTTGAKKNGPAFRQLPEIWPGELRGASSPLPCYLGRNPPAAGAKHPPEMWQGGIDELVIFDRILAEEEVLEHFDAGVVRAGLRRRPARR